MPRPTNKETLLELSQTNFNKLFSLIESLTEDQRNGEFQFEHRDRKVRDTIVHLHEWHMMMLDWYEVGMSGQKPDIPGKGYTWKTLPDLNKEIWKKYQETTSESGISLLKESFTKVRKVIEGHDDHELFEKRRYNWTGTTSLDAYLISATSSHYDWAMKLIRKHKKSSV